MKKFKRAVTDSEARVYYGENKAGINNLMGIYSCITGKSYDEIEKEFEGRGYGDFKMCIRDSIGTEDDGVLVTSGAQQIMDLFTKSILNEGETVICEAPSFIGSLNDFRSYKAKLVGIPMDTDGMNMEAVSYTHLI